MADLVVTIGADSKAYNQVLAEASKRAQQAAAEIEKSAAKIGKSISVGSNQAAFALTNLGRVAQDAPFGFIGIQNNINPLLESFQRLKAEAGSNSGALKALASSFIGPAGLGFAVSIVTAGITLFVQHQQEAARAMRDTKKDADEYAKSLDDVRQVQLKGTQAAQDETIRLQLLYKATQDQTLSLKERNEAYDELSDKYPTLFSNAEREKTLLGDNELAYYNLRKAILSAAYAKAAENKVSENANKILEIGSKIQDEQLNQENAKAREAAAKKKLNNPLSTKILIDNAAAAEGLQAIDDYNESVKRGNDLAKERLVLLKSNNKLLDIAANEERKSGFKTAFGGESGNKKTLDGIEEIRKKIKDLQLDILSHPENRLFDIAQIKKYQELLKSLTPETHTIKEQKTYLQQLEEQLNKLQSSEAEWISEGHNQDFFNLTDREKNINALIEKIATLKNAIDGVDSPTLKSSGISGLSASSPFQVNVSPEEMNKAQKAFEAYANSKSKARVDQKEYNKDLKKETELGREMVNVFGKGLTNAFESAVSGTQSLIGALGQFLGQLITQLIAAALAAAALAIILSAVGFGAGLGGAAESFGSFKNLFNGLSGIHAFADGGIVTGPTRALIGETGQPEAIIPLSRMKEFTGGGNGMQDGQIVGVLSGPDMLLKWINRAQKTQSRLS